MRPSVLPFVLAALAVLAAACGSGGEDTPAVAAPPSPASTPSSVADASAGSSTLPDPATGSSTEAGPAARPLPPAEGIPEVVQRGPEPVTIRIPDLGIGGSAVRPVGVEPNGEYEVPRASEVGWYRYGSAPGEPGSSVLAGHIAYDGENGVFSNLAGVEVGATVEVILADGVSLDYEIVELATYQKTELPFDDIFDESGPDRVVLITCGGTFNPNIRSYDSNVVAYAEPVDRPRS